MQISAILPIYNEESRIESTLRSLKWCDEIIVLDKNSTDNSREIALKFGASVYIWDQDVRYNSKEIDFLISKCSYDWVLCFTASDVIHPKLAYEIKNLIIQENEFDAIQVPYRTYILGIDSVRSPWYTKFKTCIYRKNSIIVNENCVHDAILLDSLKQYRIDLKNEYSIYHLSHSSADTMMERHIRYWKGESININKNDIEKAYHKTIRMFLFVFFKRKTYLLGLDGIMLACAFLSYYMMAFVYKWEAYRNNAPESYRTIRTNIINEWEKYQ